jgi:peptidoglycan/xylan/chitin deacetylase (PgdA/CDA1 family)
MTNFFRAFVCAVALICLAAPAPAFARDCGEGALGVSRTIAIDGAARFALGLQSYPQTLALADHEVVLTFDDGPAPTTPQVLDALEAECVKATFFLIGRNAAAMPQLVQREIRAGHSVGHHSNSHPLKTFRIMSEEAGKADIEAGIAAVNKAAGGQAAPFFRYPGFGDTKPLNAWLGARGYTIFGADNWASDWLMMTPQAELQLILSRLEHDKKGILLLHDIKKQTAAMMPDLLRELKKRGFKIVHVAPGAGPTPVVAAGPGWKSTTEPVLAKLLAGKHGAGAGGM